MRLKAYFGIGLVCLFYWILDSIWSYLSFEYNLKKLIFSEPSSYLDTLLLRVTPYQIVSRLMVVSLFVIFGVLIVEFMFKRKEVERERNEAHDTFLKVLNSIDATIYVADMQNHDILFMNQSMIDSFGDNYSGQKCYEAFRHNEMPCGHCNNDQLIDEFGNPKGVIVWEGANPITNAWYVNYDRAIKWIDGRIVHLQIATDITRLKELQKNQIKAEYQLRQAQKMEAVGTLAGGIAHDFNNILSSVIGFTELSLEEVDRETILHEYLTDVLTAGNRAKELVNQILIMSRHEEQEVKPIRVAPLITEALKMLRATIPKSIEFRVNISSEPLIVMANPTQLHQVFVNLVTNAKQAMPDGNGFLNVRVDNVSVNSKNRISPPEVPPGKYARITVSDTGIGIPEDHLGKIFEPYFTTKEKGEGTGLGLSVVHGIIKSYNGHIFARSHSGKGTTFQVFLPLVSKHSVDTSVQTQKILTTGTGRILLIDDEPSIIKMQEKSLERLGYAVTSRTSSLEALEIFRSSPNNFDLIITDMTMPSMTGDKLIQEVKTIRPDIPVILCTGFSEKLNDLKETLDYDGFLMKPIDQTKLAATVRQLIDASQKDN